MSVAITVVIPAYNAAHYLAEAIESVLYQTFTDFEVLIIDDGSTDTTAEIARLYVQKDIRVQLVSQANRGVSAARNQGIELAKGDLIAFLDADDRWLPQKLTCHFQHFQQQPNLVLSYGRVEFLQPNGESTHVFSKPPLKNLQPQCFLYENPTVTSSNLVCRKAVFSQVGCFDQSMSYSEDLEWCLRVIWQHWKVEGIDQVLVQYRTTENGLSSDLYKMETGWELLVAKARTIEPVWVEQHYAQAQATYLRYLARRAVRLALPAKIGVDFMTRAIRADWKILIREPRRTIPTVLAVYGRYGLTSLNSFRFNSKL